MIIVTSGKKGMPNEANSADALSGVFFLHLGKLKRLRIFKISFEVRDWFESLSTNWESSNGKILQVIFDSIKNFDLFMRFRFLLKK